MPTRTTEETLVVTARFTRRVIERDSAPLRAAPVAPESRSSFPPSSSSSGLFPSQLRKCQSFAVVPKKVSSK